jgi:hypothetical protein
MSPSEPLVTAVQSIPWTPVDATHMRRRALVLLAVIGAGGEPKQPKAFARQLDVAPEMVEVGAVVWPQEVGTAFRAVRHDPVPTDVNRDVLVGELSVEHKVT